MPDDTFWIGDEFGPWLLHFSVDGELLAAPVELPDACVLGRPSARASRVAATAKLEHSRGFEAMDLAGDNKTLVAILEGAGRRRRRSNSCACSVTTRLPGKWLPGTLIYELDADTLSVTDMSRIEGNRFVVIERDDQEGEAARAKRVYSIDLDKVVPG